MVAATLAIVTSALKVFMVLHYMAGENVNYGFNDPVILGVVLSLLALLGMTSSP